MDHKSSHRSRVVADGGKDIGNETTLSTGASSAASHEPRQQQPEVILTPDQRVRVFISSTLEELAAERTAARRAIANLPMLTSPLTSRRSARSRSAPGICRFR